MWEDDYIIDNWFHGSSDREVREIVARAYGRYCDDPNPCKFKAGDRVRLRNGAALMIVIGVRAQGRGHEIQAEYASKANNVYVRQPKWRTDADFTFYETTTNTTKQKETNEMNGKLYQTNEATPRFGTLLTTNSQGDLVLEMKGAAGAVEVFNASAVTVVTPYTFGVKFGGIGQEYSYLGKDGDVEVGDLLVLDESPRGDLNVARVTGVNTKAGNATKTFKGVKLVTKRLGE